MAAGIANQIHVDVHVLFPDAVGGIIGKPDKID
jgi:hypothetical protein